MKRHGTGTTESERFLLRLANQSFLRLWTYANIYRDQGGGKEVCDLLVVFDEDIVIFSDKRSAFQAGELAVAWKRWRRATVDESVDQLRGALRWIRKHPRRLFLDKSCTVPFPIDLEPARFRFHLVSVVSGAAERCATVRGLSGSLGVTSATGPRDEFFVPSLYDDLVVHVLDEVSLPIVLEHLDTAADFIDYLAAREQFVRSGNLFASDGEEHVLGSYLWEWFARGARGFARYSTPSYLLGDIWEKLSAESAFREYQRSLPPSYAWDAMIETLCDTLLDGRGMLGDEPPVAHEARIRLLAKTTRLERIDLAIGFAGLFAMPHEEGTWRYRAVRVGTRRDTIFALVLSPHEETSDPILRALRQEQLMAYCLVIKAAHSEARVVIGVATSRRTESGLHSEDVCHVNGDEWNSEIQAMVEEIAAETGLYQHTNLSFLRGSSAWNMLSPTQKRQLRNQRKRRSKTRRQ